MNEQMDKVFHGLDFLLDDLARAGQESDNDQPILTAMWWKMQTMRNLLTKMEEPVTSKLSLEVTAYGKTKVFPATIRRAEYMHGQRWVEDNAIGFDDETDHLVDLMTGRDDVCQVVEYAFVEGSCVEDDIVGLDDDDPVVHWRILLDGKPADYNTIWKAIQ